MPCSMPESLGIVSPSLKSDGRKGTLVGDCGVINDINNRNLRPKSSFLAAVFVVVVVLASAFAPVALAQQSLEIATNLPSSSSSSSSSSLLPAVQAPSLFSEVKNLTTTVSAAPNQRQQPQQQQPPVLVAPNTRGFHVFSYYNYATTGLQPWQLRCEEFTHLVWSFANIWVDGTVTLASPPSAGFDNEYQATRAEYSDYKFDCGCAGTCLKGQLGVFNEMKKKKCPHLRLILSIGGWTWSGNFSTAVSAPATRHKMITSASELMVNYGFDGLDIDWEFPDFPRTDDVNYKTSPNDLQNLALFYTEARAFWASSFSGSNTFIVTMALRAYETSKNPAWKTIAETIDYGLLMGYEYQHNSVRTRPAAPLYALPASNDEEKRSTASFGITSYTAAGFVPGKLVLGIPLYASGWTGVSANTTGPDGIRGVGISVSGPDAKPAPKLAYSVLMALRGEWVVQHLKTGAAIVRNATTVYFTDTPLTVRQKTLFARQNGLSGLMLWNTNQDLADANAALGAAIARATQLDLRATTGSCVRRKQAQYCNLLCEWGRFNSNNRNNSTGAGSFFRNGRAGGNGTFPRGSERGNNSAGNAAGAWSGGKRPWRMMEDGLLSERASGKDSTNSAGGAILPPLSGRKTLDVTSSGRKGVRIVGGSSKQLLAGLVAVIVAVYAL